eukprot:1684675-Rhodomonas_salina.1
MSGTDLPESGLSRYQSSVPRHFTESAQFLVLVYPHLGLAGTNLLHLAGLARHFEGHAHRLVRVIRRRLPWLCPVRCQTSPHECQCCSHKWQCCPHKW